MTADRGEQNADSQISLKQLRAMSRDGNDREKLALAQDTTTPGEILSLLAACHCDTIRLAVARNPHTPHHVVAMLAKDKSAAVRAGLASDSMTPFEILNELAEDDNDQVRQLAKITRRKLAATIRTQEEDERHHQITGHSTANTVSFGKLNTHWAS